MKYIGFPRPSYPLGATKERTYLHSCKPEFMKERKERGVFSRRWRICIFWLRQCPINKEHDNYLVIHEVWQPDKKQI
jgi:hypothetical protein